MLQHVVAAAQVRKVLDSRRPAILGRDSVVDVAPVGRNSTARGPTVLVARTEISSDRRSWPVSVDGSEIACGVDREQIPGSRFRRNAPGDPLCERPVSDELGDAFTAATSF